MRKLIVTGLVAAIFGTVLFAQPTPRPGSQPLVPPTKLAPGKGKTPDRPAEPKPAQAAEANTPAQPAQNLQTTASGSTTTAKSASAAPQAAAQLEVEEAVRIQWMTLEEALERSKTEKRKLFIDVYTEWCGWCKRMDQTTFSNRAVARYINEHYYAVKFDAEQQEDIVFNNKTYRFKRNGARGFHELAAEWLNNRLSYPTVVFLDENLNVIQPLSGYLEADKLQTILNYFGSDSHKTTPWETYEKKFNQR